MSEYLKLHLLVHFLSSGDYYRGVSPHRVRSSDVAKYVFLLHPIDRLVYLSYFPMRKPKHWAPT